MEATNDLQYQPVSLTKRVHISSLNEDIEVRLHISSNVVQVCVNKPDRWKEILIAKTYHCPVTPGLEVAITFANIEEAYKAIVLEAYQDHILAKEDEKNRKIQDHDTALRQQLIEKYAKATRLKEETENYIRLRIEGQVSNRQISLTQTTIQQASAYQVRLAG